MVKALFSGLTYVVNHLKVADDYGFIPIVDMENFQDGTMKKLLKKLLILGIILNLYLNIH